MKPSLNDWPELLRLLDTALDMAEAERESWLAAVPVARQSQLRELLSSRRALESADFLVKPAALPGARELPSSTAQAGQRVGPWRLLREIGEGGMGSVWLADRDDGGLKRQVALKLPRLSWQRGLPERLARERDILAPLEHAHIARLYDAGLDAKGRPWLALEYVQGQPIDEHARDKSLDLRQRVHLLIQVCDAVAYAHSRLVIHRDLKPANILVTNDGQVKLLDFGIAKLVQGEKAEATALTALSGRAMTLDYASPEQVRGEALTTASDVYSLGVVAYELLAGVRPYQLRRGSVAELEEAIQTADVPLASVAAAGPALRQGLRGGFDAILNLALKKSASERYATVAELRQDFERHLLGQPLQARPERWGQRLRRLSWRYRLALAVAAAAGLALLGGLYAQLAVMIALAAGTAAALWQRQKALEQRDSAQAERVRAAQSADDARAEAERAQRAQERADAVAEFLTDLLGEAQADAPITTGELLARAEKLAQIEAASPTQRAAVLHTIALMHLAYDNLNKAAELLTTAERLARSGEDTELLALVHTRQATVLARASSSEASRLALEHLAQQHASQPVVAHAAADALADLARNNNDAVATIAWAERMKKLVMALPRPAPRLQAEALARLAYGKSLAGHSDEALSLYAESYQHLCDAHAEESGEALGVLVNWAIAELESGNPQRALQRSDQAVAVAQRRSPDGKVPATMLANRARTLLMLNRIDDALADAEYANQAAVLSGNAGAELHALISRADALRRAGDSAGAGALIEGAELAFQGRVAAAGPVPTGLVRLQAMLDFDRGRLKEALQGIDQVIGSFDSTGLATSPLALALSSRADILLALAEPARAQADAQRALVVARKAQGQLPHSAATGTALRCQGEALAAQGQSAAAVAAWAEAEPLLANTLGGSHPETLRVQRLRRQA